MIAHSQDNSPYSPIKKHSSYVDNFTNYNRDTLLQNNNFEASINDIPKLNLFMQIEENNIIEYLLLTGFDVYTFLINEYE